MKAIVVPHVGGSEVLARSEVPEPSPGASQVLVRVAAAGVNFIDVYHRSGVYPKALPLVLGQEGAGTVVEVGAEVDWARVGDLVAWTQGQGSYAEYVVLNRAECFHVPAGVEPTVAAAAMLQGLTAHYLATSSFPLAPGHVALVHAGAGGVGLLLTQLAVARGVRVITTVSTDEKAELSRAAGASDVIRYDLLGDLAVELAAAVRELTEGRGVDVAYDGVGKTTFDASLASLAVRGTLVLLGGASGQVPPFDLQRLNSGGSLSISRPSIAHFLRTEEERAWRAGELFGAILDGGLNVRIGATYPLAEAAEAHRALEGRVTTGKVLLVP